MNETLLTNILALAQEDVETRSRLHGGGGSHDGFLLRDVLLTPRHLPKSGPESKFDPRD
ncbi:MAG: hypothetical protein WBM63_03935 [Sedimenticolaceae bacterium]|jgi:hypothetical protein